METQDEYREYKLNTLSVGSRSFFSSHPLAEWCFEKYFFLTHNQINKLKSYNRIVNDYILDLKWIITLQEVPEKVKIYCSYLLEKKIPNRAEMKADASKPSKKRRVNINYGLQVFGDSNTFTNTTINDNDDRQKEEEKKDEEVNEKENKGKEKKEEANEETASIWKDWVRFIENNENFHPYSPENHGVIRCGNGVSYRPNLDENTYQQHLKAHVEKTFSLPDVCIPYINKIFNSENNSDYKKAVRDVPPCESDDEPMFNFLESLFRATYSFHSTHLNIKDGESTFNSLFVYPFLKAVGESLAETINWCKAGFKPGEAPLISMKNQLKNFELYKEENITYLADGIIKLFGLKNLEILLLETSSHFGCTDKSKINFDHHKGLFGALAMLKNIADEFPLASLATFRQCKVFFLHAAGEHLYLWSLRFEPEGPIYELWLESMMLVKPDVDDKLESLPSFLKFFWGTKCNLIKTISIIAQLKKEHNDVLIKNRFNSNAPSNTLSTIVNPSILKLTEEEDKTGMHLLGPFFSTTSSP